MDALDPLITGPAVDAFFDLWPDDMKPKMRSEFRGQKNDTRSGYAECKGMVSVSDPINGNSFLSTFARNIAETYTGDSVTFSFGMRTNHQSRNILLGYYLDCVGIHSGILPIEEHCIAGRGAGA